MKIDLESLIIATSYANKDSDDYADYLIDLLDRIINIVNDYLRILDDDSENISFFLDAGKSFRYRNESYKSDRKKQVFPYRKELKQFAKKELKALSIPLLEADDLIGINRNNDTIIAIDDDFLTMVGRVYNYRKQELYNIDKRTANYNLAFKMLTGGHNYSTKLQGCGKKTAEIFLSNFDLIDFFQTLELVKEAYINGIPKTDYPIWRDVKASTIDNFFLSFRENYILRNISDIYLLNINIEKNPINYESISLNELIQLKELYE